MSEAVKAAVEIEEQPTRSLSAYGKGTFTIGGAPLSPKQLRKTDAHWRAYKYLALGMTYLQANPLLRESLKAEQVKNKVVGARAGLCHDDYSARQGVEDA